MNHWIEYCYREGGAGWRRDLHAFHADFNCEVAILEPAVYDVSLHSTHSEVLWRIQWSRSFGVLSSLNNRIPMDNQKPVRAFIDAHSVLDLKLRSSLTDDIYLLFCSFLKERGQITEDCYLFLRDAVALTWKELQQNAEEFSRIGCTREDSVKEVGQSEDTAEELDESQLLQPAKRLCLTSSFDMEYPDALDPVKAVEYKSGLGAAVERLAYMGGCSHVSV